MLSARASNFTLNPNAKWSDGEPVTPEDVLFTMESSREKGRPPYSDRMAKIAKLEKIGDHGVRFTFNDKADREFPLILALTPIVPKHAFDKQTFDKTTLKPLIGSGPYTVDAVQPGEYVAFKRNPNYWGKDIPSKRGFDNYDQISINYFRNDNAMFEAFKKGIGDIHVDTDTGRWASGYDFPAATTGDVVNETFDTGLPSGMSGFVINTGAEVFQTAVAARARHAFRLRMGQQEPVCRRLHAHQEFLDGLRAVVVGHPAERRPKRRCWRPTRTPCLPEVMDGTWRPPVSDGSGQDRKLLEGPRSAEGAGYKLDGGMLDGPDGKTVDLRDPAPRKTRASAAYQRTLEKLGIDVTIRSRRRRPDPARSRASILRSISADPTRLAVAGHRAGRPLGVGVADAEGTFNFAGVADPAVDAAIDAMLKARTREDFVTAVRASTAC